MRLAVARMGVWDSPASRCYRAENLEFSVKTPRCLQGEGLVVPVAENERTDAIKAEKC